MQKQGSRSRAIILQSLLTLPARELLLARQQAQQFCRFGFHYKGLSSTLTAELTKVAYLAYALEATKFPHQSQDLLR